MDTLPVALGDLRKRYGEHAEFFALDYYPKFIAGLERGDDPWDIRDDFLGDRFEGVEEDIRDDLREFEGWLCQIVFTFTYLERVGAKVREVPEALRRFAFSDQHEVDDEPLDDRDHEARVADFVMNRRTFLRRERVMTWQRAASQAKSMRLPVPARSRAAARPRERRAHRLVRSSAASGDSGSDGPGSPAGHLVERRPA